MKRDGWTHPETFDAAFVRPQAHERPRKRDFRQTDQLGERSKLRLWTDRP